MNKKQISELLLSVWGCIDTAEYSDLIEEALSNLPVHRQKEILENWALSMDSKLLWHMEPDKEDKEKLMKFINISKIDD